MFYTGKDGNEYPRRAFYCGIDADPDKDKDKLVALLKDLADVINQHPERPLSQFPESNKVHVDPEDCIMVEDKVSDVCGFGGTIRIIGLHHPNVVVDRTFGRSQVFLMNKFFKKGSLSVTEVRYLGASAHYANPEALAELRSGATKKAAIKK